MLRTVTTGILIHWAVLNPRDIDTSGTVEILGSTTA